MKKKEKNAARCRPPPVAAGGLFEKQLWHTSESKCATHRAAI